MPSKISNKPKNKGAGTLRSRWDYLALKSTFLDQLTPNFRFMVQMDALKSLQSLVKINSQEVCHPRIQCDPLSDSLKPLIIFTFFRASRELFSGEDP